MSKLKLTDIKTIEKWMRDIKTYNYAALPLEKREKMKIILAARYEAYQNVLTQTAILNILI